MHQLRTSTRLPRRCATVAVLTLLLAACGGPATPAADHHDEGDADHVDAGGTDDGAHDHDDEPKDLARIDPATAMSHGIEVATASGGRLAGELILTGQLIIDPRRVADVRARFAGPVVAVLRDVGDPVSAGTPLARIESNASLTTYNVTAPLAGTVLARNTSVGDVAGDEPLFRIGDLGALQAELQVFAGVTTPLTNGTPATVRIDGRDVPGRVSSVVPWLDAHTQARRVRVALDLPQGFAALPGRFVTARLPDGASTNAGVVVPAAAIRRLEGRDVVFVPVADGFEARTVTLGRRGDERVEIRAGLEAGERYAATGTFLLKAEIGKDLATHEH